MDGIAPINAGVFYQPARFRLRGIVRAVLLAAGAAFTVYFLPTSLADWEIVPCLVVGILLVLSLRVILGLSPASTAARNLTLFLWWVLLSSEEFFIRWSETASTLSGNFPPSAFAEAGIWVLVFAAAALVSIRDFAWLGPALQSPYRYLNLFGLVSLLSCVYAPQHVFALAWGFKLCTVILLLQLCARQMEEPGDLLRFLKVTSWGVAFLSLEPLIRATLSPDPMFVDGRLGNGISPTGLSGIASNLLLLSLMMGRVTHRLGWGVLAIAGAGIMVLAGGKTAILAGVLAAMLFFGLQKKLGTALLVFMAIVGIGAVVFTVTPLSGYIQRYTEAENAATLTGRTGLWEMAIPAILQHPILGHGYATSRFISVALGDVAWEPGHLHNGFLEVSYNNGLVGLSLLVLLHLAILKAAYGTFSIPKLPQDALQIAAGSFAIYVNILLGGMLNASFGGRAGGTFILMLALVVIGHKLFAFARGGPSASALSA